MRGSSPVPTWGALRARVTDELRRLGTPNPSAEAGWLVGEGARLGPSELVGRAVEPAVPAAVTRVLELLERRRLGEPLQYVLGSWPFRGLELMVDRRVLIPRPETEFVTGVAIETVRAQKLAEPFPVVDLGTGSGAIAIALASEVRDAEIWAVERSLAALEVAAVNATVSLPPSRRPRLLAGSWFDPLPRGLAGRLRLIVSNPPYVADHEWPMLEATVRNYEPREALVAGPTGLEAIEAVVIGAAGWLAPAGILVCELAPSQAEAATELASRAGLDRVGIRRDHSGRARVLVAGRPPARPVAY